MSAEEDRTLRQATCFRITVAAALLVGGGATVAWGGGVDALVFDGSFELGPPPASAWTEVNNSTCERIGDFSGEWYVSAYDGMYDYWAGGYCVDSLGVRFPVTSSVSQNVSVPADSAMLSFYYIAFRPDEDDVPADGDHAYVAVNGVELWTLPLIRANNTYPSWVGPITVDLGAYAGQSVELSFGGVPVGDITGNARFDYIEFIYALTPVESVSWGKVKSLYR